MTNRERLQRLAPVDRYRFLKYTIQEWEKYGMSMESLKHDLNLSDGKIDYFEPSETKEGFEYWDERLKILEA